MRVYAPLPYVGAGTPDDPYRVGVMPVAPNVLARYIAAGLTCFDPTTGTIDDMRTRVIGPLVNSLTVHARSGGTAVCSVEAPDSWASAYVQQMPTRYPFGLSLTDVYASAIRLRDQILAAARARTGNPTWGSFDPVGAAITLMRQSGANPAVLDFYTAVLTPELPTPDTYPGLVVGEGRDQVAQMNMVAGADTPNDLGSGMRVCNAAYVLIVCVETIAALS